MKRRAMPLLAALIATSALADLEPIQPQGYYPMMAPAMPGGFNPYMMMPYGMPQQVPGMMAVPYGVPYPMPQPMPGMMAVPYGMPYPMPQPMPGMMVPQQPAQAQAQPVPAPATTAAAPAAAEPAVAPAAPEPVPAPAPQPTPVAAPVPAAPVAAPAAKPAAAPAAKPAAAPAANPYLSNVQPSPFAAMMAPASQMARRPYEMRRIIDQAEKTKMVQMALPMMTNMMKMGMPDVMNYMARKYKAKEGLSFDDVRDSLFLRANQLNMKKVGENLMWKDFQAVLNDPNAPRIEVYSFCDIAVGRELLQISPEFIVFLPCRVAIMEDADKAIWVLMLDWNLDWVAGYEKQLGLSNELLDGARSINQRMDEMLRAAANGDL